MIRFYYHPTPNPAKVALFLEDTGLPYEIVPVDTAKGRSWDGCVANGAIAAWRRFRRSPKRTPSGRTGSATAWWGNARGL